MELPEPAQRRTLPNLTVDDPSGKTERSGTIRGGTGLQRMIRFDDVAAVEAHREQLLDIVDAWCSLIASGGA